METMRLLKSIKKIEKVMSEKVFPEEYYLLDDFKNTLRVLASKMKRKWFESVRNKALFLQKNEDWLKVFVPLKQTSIDVSDTQKSSTATGRPSTSFQESSERSKRRKTESLRKSADSVQLSYAAQMKLREEGKTDAAYVIKDVALGSPTKGSKYRKSIKTTHVQQQFSAEEALSVYIELDFSRNKYQLLRNACLTKSSKLFPSVKILNKARKECYPIEKIQVSKDSAEIKLQPLLHHTIERLIKMQSDVFQRLTEEQIQHLILICKWGCDGSSGHSIYKQQLDENKSDENLFFTAIVPLQLIYENPLTGQKIVAWKNPRPSSPRFCRPIKMQFVKESNELIKETVNSIQIQIGNLQPYEAVYERKKIAVYFKLCLSMIDGKVCNALSECTSAQRCYICLETCSNFNKIDYLLGLSIEEDILGFGLSTLHAWIRCFECLLHISYRLDIKKWQARTAEDKEKVGKAKKMIQLGFKTQLHLSVDIPRAGGAGSSNDGNTARAFFRNSDISAQITGIDKDLIHRFHVILQAVSCGFHINLEAYHEYALETARTYVEKYGWYYMPTAVHKLLIHGKAVISNAILPIGQMSEEAQEGCNKLFRVFRLNHARKNYREKTMEDVFKRFLEMSDPIISNCREIPKKPLRSLSADVLNLILPPSPPAYENIAEELQIDLDTSTSEESSTTNADSDYEENFLY